MHAQWVDSLVCLSPSQNDQEAKQDRVEKEAETGKSTRTDVMADESGRERGEGSEDSSTQVARDAVVSEEAVKRAVEQFLGEIPAPKALVERCKQPQSSEERESGGEATRKRPCTDGAGPSTREDPPPPKRTHDKQGAGPSADTHGEQIWSQATVCQRAFTPCGVTSPERSSQVRYLSACAWARITLNPWGPTRP